MQRVRKDNIALIKAIKDEKQNTYGGLAEVNDEVTIEILMQARLSTK